MLLWVCVVAAVLIEYVAKALAIISSCIVDIEYQQTATYKRLCCKGTLTALDRSMASRGLAYCTTFIE